MRTHFRISSLVPSGLLFQSVSDLTDSIILARPIGSTEGQVPLVRRGPSPNP